ncbi:MAG: FkbM family methyltransferase [Bacteroidia bacterium]
MIKQFVRNLLWLLHLDLTRNLRYDRATYKIMRRVLRPGDVCVDVGAHKGELVEWMLKLAPGKPVIAFEPIPHLAEGLKHRFGNRIEIHKVALSDSEGKSTFQFVKNAPAYSGLKQRSYNTDSPDIEQIEVETRRLDSFFENRIYPSLIKIDVEGAEFLVLKGSKEIFEKSSPVVLFEFGIGAADHYGTEPEAMYSLLKNYGLKVFVLNDFLNQRRGLSVGEFCEHFRNNSEYYFVAAKE